MKGRKKPDTQTQTESVASNVQVFPTNDDRLKFLGEIFSNDSSRKILTALLEKELTIMEISKETGFSANLIIHHIKKMVNSDVVTITKESTNSRGRPLRFYRAKPAIVILSKDAASRANTSKSLQKTLGKITRFASIGLAGIFTWVFANSSQIVLDSAFKYPRPTLPPYMTPIEPQMQSGEIVFAIVVTVSVVVAGLVINYLVKRIRR
ncbi:MAG: winged helix-turn-helix domain-containing protein [Nitrosopumilus sp.]|uniref:ArsR/SmtB family transcription factor n=1 Tax=Nitrosopumilus sp. TaxID=2024843 RepID=UPI00243148B1|nr:winged helix-turn-helix domain-containing protein [Nitrosopumilus sp.]MCV0366359.1 winged helix-turn-helix domain-containing protein [Nitrosopumilus sp.]